MLVSRGASPKSIISRLEPDWRQSRKKSLEVSGPDPEVFTGTKVASPNRHKNAPVVDLLSLSSAANDASQKSPN